MIALIAALALVSEPVAREAQCSINEAAPQPCTVIYINEGTVAGLGFFFDQTNHVSYVGDMSQEGIEVKLVSVNETQVEPEYGVCLASENAVGCTASLNGKEVKVVAAF